MNRVMTFSRGLIHRIRYLGIFLCCVSLPVLASNDLSQQHRVKMAFVFNIAKFVTWPNNENRTPDDEFVLCFYQYNMLGNAFDGVKGRKVDGREIRGLVVNTYQDVAPCHILLSTQEHQQQLFLESQQYHSKALPLLSIADMTSADHHTKLHESVHIGLVKKGSRIGLEVNLQPVIDANLKISSQLLKLAKVVQ